MQKNASTIKKHGKQWHTVYTVRVDLPYKCDLLNVLFRSKNNNHASRPSKVFTVWPACEARALPIDLSGVSVLNLPQSTASIIMADDVNHFEKFAALLFILNACSL